MELLTQNSKLRKTSKLLGVKVVNFGIPAYKSASGKLTCPFASECVKFCYAQKGAYIWSNVKPAFEKRYELTKKPEFISKMSDEWNSRARPGKLARRRQHRISNLYSSVGHGLCVRPCARSHPVIKPES